MTPRGLLIGRPLASSEAGHQRLSKRLGLPVFASDAISSTAYATEEVLHILVPVIGLAAFGTLVPISLVVIALLTVVVISYRQTIFAYPDGGGAYVVARSNLRPGWALVAGASLLIDYTLTVAVSVSAGVAAVASAFPVVAEHRVGLGVAVIAVIALANLRGAKESGTLFAIPTYGYLLALGALLAVGLWQVLSGDVVPIEPVPGAELPEDGGDSALTWLASSFLLARAFSSGAIALTGTEAITNGIPAFRAPESRNAARTLVIMAVLLGGAFLGISVLAEALQPLPSPQETVLSQLARTVFGGTGLPYLLLQVATTGILFLAANTAFADFPRLASLISRDGFLPRQLSHLGDRLVFSNGILLLAGAASLLVATFGGVVTALVPLYAVGVFTGFTISQAGMVVHHRTLREPGWQRGIVINGLGALATGVVLVVVVVSKFTTGAWIVVVVLPLLVLLFRRVARHYAAVKAQLRADPAWQPTWHEHTVLVLVSRVHRGTVEALAYARTLRPDHLVALHVAASQEEAAKVRRQWEALGVHDVELVVHLDPYRQLTQPVVDFVDAVEARWADDLVTVLIPEFMVDGWANLLHGQTATFLAERLRRRPHTVVTRLPIHLHDDEVAGIGG